MSFLQSGFMPAIKKPPLASVSAPVKNDHTSAFMAAVRGVPAVHVWAALNLLTPGIDWHLSAKRDIAQEYNQAMVSAQATLKQLKNLDLNKLARMSHARYAGFSDWKNA